jgi:hypothetical protein
VRPLHLPIVLAAVLLVTGCGDERPGPASRAEGAVSAAPSPTSTPSPTPTAAPTPAAPTGPLAQFPLALGYDHENGDDHSPVAVTDQPGLGRVFYCDRPVWDPQAGTTDLIGVEFRGEAEWARGRTLVRYPTVQAATASLESARDTLVGCPEEAVGDGYFSAHTIYDDISLGGQSLVWTDTGGYRQDGEIRFDTGLTVYHLVRVGRAVLGSYEYGEGNGGGPGVRSPSIDRATDADRPVVDRMWDLAS